MSITDELREGGIYRPSTNTRVFPEEELTAIADRIDAEHERVVRERRRSCVYYDPERHYCSCHELDVSGYVELPKDADGVPIRAGDRLDGYGKTIEVVELRYGRSGWVIVSRDGNAYADTFAFTHYHAPTVEDVLREFFSRYVTTKPKDEDDAILAEYAAKLRLAKEDE